VENCEFSEMGLDVLCALSLPLSPAADDLWPISYTYCNNLPIATMLMPTPRKTPAVNAETGLVPAPNAVDVLPIDLKRQAQLCNYCGALKAVNMKSALYY
jgi:hypothetical protein